MRLNKYIADNSNHSRRKADELITSGRVLVNDKVAKLGDVVADYDVILLDGQRITERTKHTTVLLNKPVGYVCSRDGQGSPTVYDLLPKKYQHLNIAGRLDKDSSGLVVLTDDGDLLHKLTHPSKHKEKVYEIITDRELTDGEMNRLLDGVDIGDSRPSKFKKIKKTGHKKYEITLEEGRNRQIRRTIHALGTEVIMLHRTKLAGYSIKEGKQFEIV